MKKILNKNRAIIISLLNKNINSKFLKPNFKTKESQPVNYQRDIRIYKGGMLYRISPIIKSQIRAFRVENKNGFVGYTLSYEQKKGMIEINAIPDTVRISFDKANKLLKLVGKDAVGGWMPQITPLYREGEITKYTLGGISMSQHTTTYKEQKNAKISKI